MFDIWLGSISFTMLMIVIAAAVILPLQLLLCFCVKPLLFRFSLMLLILAALIVCVIAGHIAGGWHALFLFVFAPIYAALMLIACGIGWGIWGIVRLIKKYAGSAR